MQPYFSLHQNIQEFHSERNLAAEWSKIFGRFGNVKRHVSNQGKTNRLVSRIFEFGGNTFSSLCGSLDV